MARLHSNLGERTVYTPNGIAEAQGFTCRVYVDAAGTTPANLAAYSPASPNTPGASITGGILTVDAYSNRPAFWDVDNSDALYVTVNGGPLEPIYPDAQPQIAALLARVAALEGAGGGGSTYGFSWSSSTPNLVTADDTATGISYSTGVVTVADTAVGVSYTNGVLTVTSA